jgi:hypothetical protein
MAKTVCLLSVLCGTSASAGKTGKNHIGNKTRANWREHGIGLGEEVGRDT